MEWLLAKMIVPINAKEVLYLAHTGAIQDNMLPFFTDTGYTGYEGIRAISILFNVPTGIVRSCAECMCSFSGVHVVCCICIPSPVLCAYQGLYYMHIKACIMHVYSINTFMCQFGH